MVHNYRKGICLELMHEPGEDIIIFKMYGTIKWDFILNAM